MISRIKVERETLRVPYLTTGVTVEGLSPAKSTQN